jgi:hypothetical protein
MDEVIEILDIDIENVEAPPKNLPSLVEPPASEDNFQQDMDEARKTYYKLIEDGKSALDGALKVANLSENPRAYEVVGGLLRNLAEVNKQFAELASLNRAKEEKENPVQTVTNNVQFIGTSADLNKLIADKLKEQ